MKRYLLFTLIAVLTLQSCMTTVVFQGLRPADISLPGNFKNVVLVNRYKPAKQNRWFNTVEGIFTGEILFADKQGVDEALAALQGRLQSGPKYNTFIANEMLEGSGTGILPPPLTKTQIQNLCAQYRADAVIAIEAFDSDIGIQTASKTRKRTEKGKEIIESYFEAIEQVNVKIGWRIYNGENGAIIDQHQTYATKEFASEGFTPEEARRGLVFPTQAIFQTGREGGDLYGIRIAPSWVTYERMIYTKAAGLGSMKIAKRKALRGDWKEAVTIWERLSRSEDLKIAGRTTYNMAVAYEFMNDYDNALKFVRKASDKYHLVRADQYIQVLNNRLAELKRLDFQMQEPAVTPGE